ncbi:adhesion G protein-coupled receptor B1-like [Crassostrea angulata]|uniref:adhesion G protein-coupled receptor B1-like n=1 Tax=Magallana angulata TaxID=2784310 RepID=UPI0022B1CA30|nr:adhesion G protein-coupled receptor B1-like [Crassostrea angulata]
MDIRGEVRIFAYIYIVCLFRNGFCSNGCSVAENWSVYSQNCYRCISDTSSWYAARSSCQKLEADLVTISNAGTQSFLEKLCPNTNRWIGLNDRHIENNFTWIADPTILLIYKPYDNWGYGEPNNYKGNEDCVYMTASNTWNDSPCSHEFRHYMCQKPLDLLQILNFESSSSVVHEGDSVWFKSQIRSKTMYEVQWFHNGYLITNSSRRYKMTSSKTEKNTYLHILLIANVLQRDMGAWEIRMSSHLTQASRNLTLTVFPRLILFMNPKYNFSILMGDEMNVQCTVTNPESLFDVTNGSLVITKDGSVLQEISSLNLSTTWNKYSAVEADSGRYTCTHSGYHVPVSVSVYVTVIQPEQKRCESEWSESVQWKATLAGTTKQEPCPAKQKGSAKRYCEPLGVWASPSLINCTSEAFTNVSLLLDVPIEDGIQDTKMVQDKVNNAIQTMKNIISTNELSAGDLSSSLDILEKIVALTNSTGSIIEKENVFYGVIDNVLSANNSKSWKTVSEKTVKDGSSILKNVDRLSEIVLQRDNITATHFRGSNYELTIDKTKIDETGIRFPDVPTNNISGSSEQISTFLELPKQETKVKKEIYYVAIVYKSISDILPSDLDKDQSKRSFDHTSKEKEYVNSPVVSLTTQNDFGLLVPPLNISFGHIKNESSKMYAVCVSWNFTVSKWTERGCNVSQSDHKRTVCQCNHLTNFAILMRPYSPATEDKQLLKTMSLVGVILSISFTVLTCVIYILTWRYIKSDQNIIMMNLCGSLILSYVIFSSAVEQTGHDGICIAITAIIHYLFLVTFFSMLGMGVYYFISITVTYYAMYVANNFKARSRVHWFLLAIWGIPIILTTATLGAFWGKGYHLESFCWLSPDSGSLYMFIVPVCLISVLNVVIIVTLVRVLCVSKAMAKSSLQKKASSALRSLGTLLPVLGVTWLFGILAVNEKADVFQYIFVFANSLQGFFIFISHVLLNQKVMQGLRNKYPALSTLASKDEHSKIETTSVSRSQSTCKPDASLVETKKQSIFDKTHNKKVKKSESFIAETTLATDCPLSTGHDKNSVLPDIYK